MISAHMEKGKKMGLIDADAMMKHLEDLLCGDCDTPRKEGWCDVCDYAFLMSEMKKEPTVELKHGHWIDENGKPASWDDMNIGCPSVSCFCSKCGDWLTASDEYPARGYYCPNCGAKMDEVTDETDKC